ncbi:MAG: hypothetical protein HN909_07125 [Phycisphaerales bacterium]|jgi:predicted RNA-binding Zn-ribbon protein involved in translation (DUF1610 family)|nr:hypothetical protein [Phycisphaerales bacterium]MBT7171523.1 hypothetical protein [Phycisphaerales bacterium]
MASQKTTCAECGATIDVPDGVGEMDCPSCGTALLIHRKTIRSGKWRGRLKTLFWALAILVPVMMIWPDPPQEMMIIAVGMVLAIGAANR